MTDGLGPLIEAARRETDRRLGARPEAAGHALDPVHAMLASIDRQLRFMAGVVASGEAPTMEQVNGLTLGVIAVREFEVDDPAYCDLLCDAAFLFKALATGPA
ncbi:MAG: immunity protein Tsi6 family protein [Acidimicrobiales bacterium]